jgi:hypothetical protein
MAAALAPVALDALSDEEFFPQSAKSTVQLKEHAHE